MALATQCPHCFTTFRVAADQLKLRGGIVRCGACQSVFDGNAHLIDLDKLAAEKAASEAAAADAPAATGPDLPEPAAPAAVEVPETFPAPAAPAAAPDGGAQPVYTLDFDRTFDPLGILPKVTAPDEDVVPPAQPAPEAPAAAPAGPESVEESVAAPESELEPAPRAQVWRTGASRPGEDEPASEPVDTAAAPPAAPEPAMQTPAIADTVGADTAVDTPPVPAPDGVPHTDGAVTPPSFQPVPASAYAPPGRIEPSFDLPPDEELVAQPLPDFDPEPAFEAAFEATPAPASDPAPEPLPQPAAIPLTTPPAASPAASPAAAAADTFAAALPLRASAASADSGAAPAPLPPSKSARAKAAEVRTRRSKLTPTKIEAPKLRVPVDGDVDEPEFVKRSRRQARSSRTRRILMGAGAAVLLLALATQVVLNFRNGLAARYPGAKPVLGAACALLGCRVELPAEVENLAIETGELNPLGADTYVLTTLLRNGGSLVQAWPSIELELVDDDNKPVLRRVLGPADYLPRGTPPGAGFGAHSEQPVKLHFALAGLKPSGYHTFVFYP